MHIFLKKIRAFVAAVTVEYSKVAAPGPSSFEVRLCYVHNDRDTVFVVILHQSVKGIDGVSLYGAIAALDELDSVNPWNRPTLLLLFLSHLLLTIISI